MSYSPHQQNAGDEPVTTQLPYIRSALEPLTDAEIAALREQHQPGKGGHARAGCKVCRLLATIESDRASRDKLAEALVISVERASHG